MDEIDLPEGIKGRELEDFAALHLETVSPFPLAQLAWGFLCNREIGKFLIYATLREKIVQPIRKAEEDGDAEQHLLTIGVGVSGLCRGEREVLVLKSDQGIWLLEFTEDEILPTVLDYITPSEPDESDGEAGKDHLVERFKKMCPSDYPMDQIRFLETDWCLKWSKGRGVFQFSEWGENGKEDRNLEGRSFSRQDLWWADLRNSDFKISLRKQARRETFFAYACVAAVLFLILSIGIEFLNIGFGAANNRLDQRIDSARGLVSELEDKHRLREQLYSLLADEPGTFAFLTYINALRDPAVHYNRVESRGDQVVIDCETNSVENVNEFVNRLRSGTGITSVEMSNQTTRVTGSVTFTLTLRGRAPDANRQSPQPDAPESALAMIGGSE